MRSGRCYGDHRRSSRCQILLGQRQRTRHGILATVCFVSGSTLLAGILDCLDKIYNVSIKTCQLWKAVISTNTDDIILLSATVGHLQKNVG